jgi:methyltransferase-like protein
VPADAYKIQKAAAAARATLREFATAIRPDGAYPQLLKQETDSIQNQADHYLYHEHLEEVNEPVYFHQFIDLAKRRGLKYLGEARVGTMVTGNFAPEVETTLRRLASDQIQAEQYMDFLRNRMFRETLLCSEKHTVNWSMVPDSVRALHVASPARPVIPEGQTELNLANEDSVTFRTASGMTMATNRPILKLAMHLLQTVYPASIPFDALRNQARSNLGGNANDPKTIAEDTQMLAVGLLNCYMGSDLIELYGMPIAFARAAGEYPLAFPLARIHAAKSGIIATRRHEPVKLNELDRHLIPLLDGSNDRPALIAKLTAFAVAGTIKVRRHDAVLTDEAEIRTALETILDTALSNVARMGILAG